jgi:hypothetical protein
VLPRSRTINSIVDPSVKDRGQRGSPLALARSLLFAKTAPDNERSIDSMRRIREFLLDIPGVDWMVGQTITSVPDHHFRAAHG